MKRIYRLSICALLVLLMLTLSAWAADDAPQFSVTVPAALPVSVDADGGVSVATDAKIENHSAGAVKLDSIRVEPQNDWTLAPWGTDYGKTAVDSKTFSLKINGAGVPGSGAVDVSGYAAIDSGKNAALTYDAKLAAQSKARSETVACVVFTVSWDGHGPLSGIAVTTAPAKTSYSAGSAFNSGGMAVTAAYADGTTAAVSGWTVTDGASLSEGQTSVTVSYTEGGITRTASTPITVNAKRLSSIAVTTAPTKTTYIAGNNFDSAGMEVTASYTDGSSAVVSGWTVTNGTSLPAGRTSVTVSYTEDGVTRTATTPITVNAKALSGIYVSGAPNKFEYESGESFDAAGMTVTANYNDGTSKLVTGFTVTSTPMTNSYTDGTVLYNSASISYTENGVTKQSSYTFAVKNSVQRLEISGNPKTIYSDGNIFDCSGMIVTAYHTNGSRTLTEGNGWNGTYIVDDVYMEAGRTSVEIIHFYNNARYTATLAVKVASGPIPETIAVGETIQFGTLLMNGNIQPGSSPGTYSSNATLGFGDSAGWRSINWIKVSDNLLVADRVLLKALTWDDINRYGFVYGKKVTIDGFDYKVRLFTGGASEAQRYTNNEWADYVFYGDVSPNWNDGQSFTQTTFYEDGMRMCVYRGGNSIGAWSYCTTDSSSWSLGWRPVLEIIEQSDSSGSGSGSAAPTPESIGIGESIRFGTLFLAGGAMNADDSALYSGQAITIGSTSGSLYGVKDINWIKVSNNMLIADRNLLRGISWSEINTPGFIYGTSVMIDGKSYTIRSLSGGGSSSNTSGSEWDQYIINGPYPSSNVMWHWSGSASWTSTASSSTEAVLRGGGTVYDWTTDAKSDYADYNGFRPCLILN